MARDKPTAQRNPGRNPFEGNDSPPLVDIRYRNGLVARAVNPNQRRWKRWPKGEDSFDIVSGCERRAQSIP